MFKNRRALELVPSDPRDSLTLLMTLNSAETRSHHIEKQRSPISTASG